MDNEATNQAAEADAAPVQPAPATAAVAAGHRSDFWATARRCVVELLIVFFGVYAAFLLNRSDSDRRDERRKLQILAALERETQGSVDEITDAISRNEPLLTEFERRLASGEMPGLSISMNNSAYSATDDATLLQAGGLELLNVPTIELLRNVNSMRRAADAARRNQFELSLAELTNHESADFYDQTTHQLKNNYRWWPYVQRVSINDAKALLAAEKTLLSHIRAQRGASHPAASPRGQNAPSASTPAAGVP